MVTIIMIAGVLTRWVIHHRMSYVVMAICNTYISPWQPHNMVVMAIDWCVYVEYWQEIADSSSTRCHCWIRCKMIWDFIIISSRTQQTCLMSVLFHPFLPSILAVGAFTGREGEYYHLYYFCLSYMYCECVIMLYCVCVIMLCYIVYVW